MEFGGSDRGTGSVFDVSNYFPVSYQELCIKLHPDKLNVTPYIFHEHNPHPDLMQSIKELLEENPRLKRYVIKN